MEEFIAAALDQRKVLNAKNINTIFGEGPIFNHWDERKLGSVHRLDQRMWSGLHLAAFVRCGVRQQVDALQGMWMPAHQPVCWAHLSGPPAAALDRQHNRLMPSCMASASDALLLAAVPFAAELDQDHDGMITVKDLKDALEECNIRCAMPAVHFTLANLGWLAWEQKRVYHWAERSRLLGACRASLPTGPHPPAAAGPNLASIAFPVAASRRRPWGD